MRNALALSLAAALVLLCACASPSKVENAWKDPSFQPSAPQKAVVISLNRDASLRRKVEDSFVEQLKKKGVEGIQSYTFAPEQEMTKEQLLSEVRRRGADTVLLSSVVDRKKTDTYVPPAPSPGIYPYYSARYSMAYTPGYTVSTEDAISEVKAFDVAKEQQVWGARVATSIDGGVSDKTINGFTEKVVKSFLEGRPDRKG
jgi:hypothetical protein